MTVISFDQDGKELKHVLFIYKVASNSNNSYQDYAIELKKSNVFSILNYTKYICILSSRILDIIGIVMYPIRIYALGEVITILA